LLGFEAGHAPGDRICRALYEQQRGGRSGKNSGVPDLQPRQRAVRLRRALLGLGKWCAGIVAAILSSFGVVYLTTDRGPKLTEITLLRPYEADRLSNGLHVAEARRGTCGRYAQGSGNPEALRCSSGSSVIDPCYPSHSKDAAACPERPWGGRVVIIRPLRLTRESPAERRRRPPYRTAFPGSSDRAFGLRLRNDDRCFFVQGAGQITVAGVRVNYKCEKGDIVGDPDRRRDVWRAIYAPHGSAQTVSVDVVEAWF
jgi:hypothetical protein